MIRVTVDEDKRLVRAAVNWPRVEKRKLCVAFVNVEHGFLPCRFVGEHF